MRRFWIVLISSTCLFFVATSVVLENLPYNCGAKPRNTQNHESKNCNQDERFYHKLFSDPVGFFTFILAIGTIGLANATVQLIIITQKGIRDQARIGSDSLKMAARAAKTSEEATNISRLTMVASNRPYVRHAGIKYLSHRDRVSGRIFWSIRPMWANSGKTPTRLTEMYIGFSLVEEARTLDNSKYECDGPARTDLIQDNIIQHGIYNIFGSDLIDVREGRKFFYVWGYITYKDRFPDTPSYITRFCVQAIRIDGDPEVAYNTESNIVEIHFGSFGPFNCHDEACNIN